jgi:hypothetical protein
MSFESIFKKTTPLYVGWIFLHFIAVHLYANYCNNFSLYGLIFSPLTLSTPMCRGLNYIIYNGSNNINGMWLILGSWLSQFLISPKD